MARRDQFRRLRLLLVAITQCSNSPRNEHLVCASWLVRPTAATSNRAPLRYGLNTYPISVAVTGRKLHTGVV
jgi:hypothetical protein